MKSDGVSKIFGHDGAKKVLEFIYESIIPHEQSYCFYMQKHVRQFEIVTNSGHEGTNHGIKSGPSCVLPQHSIDKSAKILLDRDCKKFELDHQDLALSLLGTV